ncbi:MAG TPA: WD40 repeat domain-containing protein [Candidatus Dormibacteraeota bacterium]
MAAPAVDTRPGAAAVPLWRTGLSDHVAALAIAPGRGMVAAGSLGGDAVVLDAADGTPVARLAEHPLGVLSLAWSPGGRRLATGGQDGRVSLWDRIDGAFGSIDLPGWVVALAWSPDGALLAAAGGRDVAVVRSDGTIVARYGGHPSTVSSLDWEPGGGRLAVAAYGGVRWYDPRRDLAAPVQEYAWKGSILTVAVSPDGRWLASGNQDSTSKVWAIPTGEDLEMTGYPAKVERLAWDDRGDNLAVASSEIVMVWRCGGPGPEGTRPHLLEAHTDRITDLRFQQSGSLLATVGRDGLLAVWNLAKRRRPHRALAVGEPLSSAGWVAGDSLVVGTAAGEVLRLGIGGGGPAPRR